MTIRHNGEPDQEIVRRSEGRETPESRAKVQVSYTWRTGRLRRVRVQRIIETRDNGGGAVQLPLWTDSNPAPA